jgi:preprotein translocase subunit SecD
MNRRAFLLSAALVASSQAIASDSDSGSSPSKKIADGVYAVLRSGDKEKDLLPLKDGESMTIDRQRYQKVDGKEPPRYLVVHAAPEVKLELAAEPKADKDGDDVVRIFLKLQPKSAAALEKLTRDRQYKQLAIVLDGEVVTVHKIREPIPNGDVQITSCSPGGATYLMKQLQAHRKDK